jgi:hypothetical protein
VRIFACSGDKSDVSISDGWISCLFGGIIGGKEGGDFARAFH